MKIVLLSLILVLASCASTTPTAPVYSDTMEMIRSAAASAPTGVEGEYILKIKASGRDRSAVYLNTELDYRDQRNITIALHPKVAFELFKKYDQDPQAFFIGKSIKVNGKVKRAKIDFISKGQKTDKYYYQTHIRVKDISQIEVIEGHA